MPAGTDFNPRSPCGERLYDNPTKWQSFGFQSTLPVRGATLLTPRTPVSLLLFQSTLPVRGATTDELLRCPDWPISIHAPRAGSDSEGMTQTRPFLDFNPRSPCGERLLHLALSREQFRFQSTLPVRGATEPYEPRRPPCIPISIHAPRAGSDLRGERVAGCLDISIHAPRAGSDDHVRFGHAFS